MTMSQPHVLSTHADAVMHGMASPPWCFTAVTPAWGDGGLLYQARAWPRPWRRSGMRLAHFNKVGADPRERVRIDHVQRRHRAAKGGSPTPWQPPSWMFPEPIHGNQNMFEHGTSC